MLEIQRLSSQIREARISKNLMGVVTTEDEEDTYKKRHIMMVKVTLDTIASMRYRYIWTNKHHHEHYTRQYQDSLIKLDKIL